MIQHSTIPPISFPAESAMQSAWNEYAATAYVAEDGDAKASLPAILFTTALSMILAAVGFVTARLALELAPLPSAGMAAICLLLMMGPSSVLASALTGSPAIGRNLGLSCGLTLLTLLFFAGCALVGGVAALVFMMTEVSVIRG